MYPCKLKIDDIPYNSAEHYYQNQKCILLKEHELAEKILDVETPREAMTIGKAARASDKWHEGTGTEIMSRLISAKYDQIPELRALLTSHKGKYFVEATRNTKWGSGIPIHWQEAMNKNKWQGQNIFGVLLSKYAETITDG